MKFMEYIKMKRESSITNVSLVPASIFFGPGYSDKFVARGTSVEDEREGFSGMPIRTSPIVNIDISAGTIETLNTIYRIV